MRYLARPVLLASAAALAACTTLTPGSQATPQAQADCVAAAARYFKLPATGIQVASSQMSDTSSQLFDVDLNLPGGRRARCSVDTNGAVQGVLERR